MTTIRVLIADDHPVYRDGLAAQLDADDRLEVVCLAGDGDGALAGLQQHEPDVAVLDLKLPGLDGIEIIREAARLGLPTRCIIVSAYEDSATVLHAITAGAAAYLLKICSAAEVAQTLVTVAGGDTVIPPALQTGLAEELRRRYADPSEAIRLTERELDVLRLAADGHSIKGIANELFIGVTTVKTHLQHVYDKLGVGDRAAAIAAAMRKGLLD